MTDAIERVVRAIAEFPEDPEMAARNAIDALRKPNETILRAIAEALTSASYLQAVECGLAAWRAGIDAALGETEFQHAVRKAVAKRAK